MKSTSDSLTSSLEEYRAPSKVLVVDDNPIIQEVAQGLLCDMGINADITSNGEEAIQKLAIEPAGSYSLVLMDCQMPIMDGYTATRRIREGGAAQHCRLIPIVALTASTMEGDSERCLLAGMDDYLSKPLDAVALAQKVRRWIPHLSQENVQFEIRQPRTDIVEAVTTVVWDKAALLKRVRQQESRAEKLITVFCDLLPERMASLECALEKGDFEKVADVSHSLKGSAASIGANQMQATCELMETLARSGNTGEITGLKARLAAEKDALIELLGIAKQK